MCDDTGRDSRRPELCRIFTNSEPVDLRVGDLGKFDRVSRADSAFGLPDNEMTQPIIAAIKLRWNMTGNASICA
jgi:hypothetical protein